MPNLRFIRFLEINLFIPLLNFNMSSVFSHSFLNPGPAPAPALGTIFKQGWTVVKEDGSFKLWTKKYLVLREGLMDFYKNKVSLKVKLDEANRIGIWESIIFSTTLYSFQCESS